MIVESPHTSQSARQTKHTLREVVLCIVRHQGRICLLKRSQLVGSDRGNWQFITGYLPEGRQAYDHALQELYEETNLRPERLRLRARRSMFFPGPWRVHAFLFDADTREIHLNWEHTEAQWIAESRIDDVDCVAWAKATWQALASAHGSEKTGRYPAGDRVVQQTELRR